MGVDIGTSNIKIAQVSHDKQNMLETYGMVNVAYQLGGQNDDAAVVKMSEALKVLIHKAGVTTRHCVISFPNSAVFTSVIQLPKMSVKELGSAVEFEAKKYVPLALSDVDLSWIILSEGDQAAANIQVLLTAVPKQITKNYLKVFEGAGLEPEVGEIEALALIRSLVGNAPINCVIIDIGAKSTGINIIESGLLRLSRNLNIGGDTITDKIAQSLNISQGRAEQFKRDFGVSDSTFIPDSIKPVLNTIKNEVKQLLTIYESHGIKLDKILLVGGGANLPGIVGYFQDLGVGIELGNALKSVAFSQSLAPVLKRYALNLPIAIGLALRNE